MKRFYPNAVKAGAFVDGGPLPLVTVDVVDSGER